MGTPVNNLTSKEERQKKMKMSPLLALSVFVLFIGSASAKINFAAGKGEGPALPEHQVMMNTPMNTGMMVEESMSGPLAITGGILILLSLVMAINYQQAQAAAFRRSIDVNRRSGEARAANEYYSNVGSAAHRWERR